MEGIFLTPHLDVSCSVLGRSRATEGDHDHVISPGNQHLRVQCWLADDLMAVEVEQLVAHRKLQVYILGLNADSSLSTFSIIESLVSLQITGRLHDTYDILLNPIKTLSTKTARLNIL